MNRTEIENRLRETLLPVFGLESADEISAEASLVKDLGADSLDFVEISYLIERDFDVVLNTSQLIVGGVGVNADSHFVEGRLTEEGAAALKNQFPEGAGRFVAGLTKVDMFRSITVRDLANIINQNGAKQSC